MTESQQPAIAADVCAAISEYGAAILHKIGHGRKNPPPISAMEPPWLILENTRQKL
ncbi:hypothetical protein L195_g000717 [Trifolium pratense]|uniref:Uncharacterized protein n=1 Tax=Trifolium pratense TaxID=57577 RepID=A0A2K3NMQ9_TRIPR|nr:hypothetical protein L195_g000717 [Trifolium pratense]